MFTFYVDPCQFCICRLSFIDPLFIVIYNKKYVGNIINIIGMYVDRLNAYE